MQAASRVVVHDGTLPGAQAVPVAGARNIVVAMSYGDGFATPPPTTPGKQLTVLSFTSGPYASSILIRALQITVCLYTTLKEAYFSFCVNTLVSIV